MDAFNFTSKLSPSDFSLAFEFSVCCTDHDDESLTKFLCRVMSTFSNAAVDVQSPLPRRTCPTVVQGIGKL